MGKLIRCAALAAALVPSAAAAQADYPAAAVKVVVANTAGTAGDNLVRIIAARLSEVAGKQFYVVNHPGAGGSIGAEIAARSAPDGYTILQTSTPMMVIAPHVYKNLKYKPLEDFAPLVTFAKTENVLVTHPSLPVQSVKDVIAYGKANPGKLQMANAGIGFQSHISNVMFANMAGIEALHVPYKGASSMMSVIGGESHMTIAPLPAVIGNMRSGRLKAIAVTGMGRSSIVPELPTVNESGLPGFSASGWNGLVAPRQTPPAVLAKLTALLTKVLAEDEIKEQIRRGGGEPWVIAGDEMGAFIRQEHARYGEVIRAAKIQIE